MKCQVVCPVNKGRLKYKNTGVLFSSKETHAILDPHFMNPKLSVTIETKFFALGLSESSDILLRNFRDFICASFGNKAHHETIYIRGKKGIHANQK